MSGLFVGFAMTDREQSTVAGPTDRRRVFPRSCRPAAVPRRGPQDRAADENKSWSCLRMLAGVPTVPPRLATPLWHVADASLASIGLPADARNTPDLATQPPNARMVSRRGPGQRPLRYSSGTGGSASPANGNSTSLSRSSGSARDGAMPLSRPQRAGAGAGAVYGLGPEPGRGWWPTCPAPG